MAPQKNPVVSRSRKGVDKYDGIVDNLIRRDYKPTAGNPPRPLLFGIDPGLSGAIAVVDLDRMVLIDMIDLPTFDKPSNSRKQGYLRFLDIHALSTLVDQYAPFVSLAVLEEPVGLPNQSSATTFSFGHTCGQIHGVLAGHYVPVMPVKPAVWKSALALSSNKDESRRKASEYFPSNSHLWHQKQHNDRAEAALLTVYAHKYLNMVIKLNR